MNPQALNGWIILDKPTGVTSAHAVGKVKSILSRHPARCEASAQDPSAVDSAQRLRRSQNDKVKIGHAGTLDPLASGILPLALGEATKTVAYMMDTGKVYAFTVSWGEERDTDDREGTVTETSANRPSQQQILDILPQFKGLVKQVPPVYSAIKVDGDRAYALAREGKAVELAAREVLVHSLSLSEYHADKSTFICHCGKGTYIRSLARDMGRALGCFGHVSMLRRLKVGRFDESTAISLEVLEEMVHKGALGFLQPVESALDDIPAVDIDSSQASLLKRGQAIPLKRSVSSETVLAQLDGKAIAICSIAQGLMRPVRVFNL